MFKQIKNKWRFNFTTSFYFIIAMFHLSTTHQSINKTRIWHNCDFYLHNAQLEAAKSNLMLIHPPSRAGHKATSSYSTLRPLFPAQSIYV